MPPAFAPTLVPELLVTDIERSLEFWCARCGFEVQYARTQERFAYLALGSAHVMLEQAGVNRNWLAGPLEAPFGRGINLQITVPDAASVALALRSAGVGLFMEPETTWYRVGDEDAGVCQFVVADPDGYLLRFQSAPERGSIA